MSKPSISYDVATQKTWRCFVAPDIVICKALSLFPDGSIADFEGAPFHRWTIDNDRLEIFDHANDLVAYFHQIIEASGDYILRGAYLRYPFAGQVMCLERPYQGSVIYTSSSTNKYLRHQIYRYGWAIGDHTYGNPTILEPDCARLTIGNFTSMAGTATICLGNHLTTVVTTYPFSSLREFWPTAPDRPDHAGKGDTTIGSDVWICENSILLPGVTIGDGAIIGAHAVVTKDVPPYAKVGGNPARLLGYRFDEPTRQRLLAVKWWNWDLDRIRQNVPLLMSDIELFLETFAPAEASEAL